jgi:hypothetical protein
MMISRSNTRHDIVSLETAAAVARGGFACIFSSSDEYERALIKERRARGRYTFSRSGWSTAVLIALLVTIVGTVAYWT